MKNHFLYCLKCKRMLNDSTIICPHCKSEYSQVTLRYKKNIKISNVDELYRYYLPFSLFTKNNFRNCSFKRYAKNIWIKNEGENSSKSIKEKELIVGLKVAQYFGVNRPYCISSGTGVFASNHLSKKLNIPIKIYSPKTSKRIFKNQLILGDDYEDTFKKMLLKKDIYSFNITPGINPYSQEGAKVISWQLIKTNTKVDSIILPCGNGSSLWGIYKGYAEAKQNGLIKKIPRICGVELKNGPIGRSLTSTGIKKNKNIWYSKAHGIDVKESFCSQKAILALKKTNGEMVAVSEDEIEHAYNELHKKGFKSNYTASASLAGAKLLLKKYPHFSVSCILSANE